MSAAIDKAAGPVLADTSGSRRDLIWLASRLYAAYCALAISRADVYLAKMQLFPPPVLVYFSLAIAMAALAACAGRVRWTALRTPYSFIVMPLIALAVVALVQLPRSQNSTDGLQYAFLPLTNLLAICIAPLAMSAFVTWQRWRVALILALLLILGSLIVDLVLPGTFSAVLSRPAGFPENPNQTAAILCVLTTLLLDYRKATVGSLFVLLLGGTGVLATLSRGGMVLFAFITLAFLFSTFVLNARRVKASTLGVVVVGAVIAIVGATQLVKSSDAYQTAGAQRRLSILTGERTLVRSDDARVQIAQVAMTQIEQHPFAGHGPAASRLGALGAHNLYLSLWWDYGILAVLAYVAMLAGGILASFHYRQVGAAVLFVVLGLASMVSHTLLDARATHFAIASAMVLCVSGVRNARRAGVVTTGSRSIAVHPAS